ncbi:alpha/beta-hydrolase [Calocera cornea HHB12733]|uniref:Alpha/beta-hydrolase n=1 Tax=Calocera cornea HHB12733 TaxID=1353952 RepID=A0A165FWP5_9BASI|nr:alpha/beta-hydrolase [Calocera cornea HHB12733]
MLEPAPAYSIPAPLSITYSEVDGLPLSCDLYLPPCSSYPAHSPARPAVIYWHGGGLTCGDRRTWFPTWLCALVLQKGYIFVSADHRLLIPCTGHDVLCDALAVFAFFQSPLARAAVQQLDGNSGRVWVDPNRLAAAGTSAGGYLAYLAGAHLGRERVRAVLGMYSMGGDFFTPHYLSRKTVPFMNDRPLLGRELFAPLLSPVPGDPPLKALAGSKLEFDDTGFPADPRILLARYLLQEAVWLDCLTGQPGFTAQLASGPDPAPAAAVSPQHRALFPQLLPLAHFPPTLLVHGTADTAVHLAESQAMAAQLRASGVGVEQLWLEGRKHSFDFHEAGWEGEVLPGVERWLGLLEEREEEDVPKLTKQGVGLQGHARAIPQTPRGERTRAGSLVGSPGPTQAKHMRTWSSKSASAGTGRRSGEFGLEISNIVR